MKGHDFILCVLFLQHMKYLYAESNLKLTNKLQPTTGQRFCNQDDGNLFGGINPLSWCIPTDYDAEASPWKYRDILNASLPWNYHFTFRILEIQEVYDPKQTVTFSMYFELKWLEPRLKINTNSSKWKPSGTTRYPSSYLKYFWYPDLEIYNMQIFSVPRSLKETSSVRIYSKKHVEYTTKVDVTFSCLMNFDNYPLDHHECPVRISSYFSSEETVTCSSEYHFDNKAQRSLQYSFEIAPLPSKYQRLNYFGTGYTICGFNILLVRRISQIFFQVYLTSTLLVIVSWASFLIKPSVVPGRMGLLVTLFLVLINIFNGAKGSAPTSKKLNAIDVFLVICFGHVFMALMEYVIILFLEGFEKKISASCLTNSKQQPSAGVQIQVTGKNLETTVNDAFPTLDLISLGMFPLSFIISVAVYCIIFV